MSVAGVASSTSDFELIPSIDLIDGKAVRLTKGEFASAQVYGDPVLIVSSWGAPPGTRLHVVDLEASRTGAPREVATVSRLAALGFAIQAGGGVRSAADARRWIDAGATRVVVGTVAADDPALLEAIARSVGAERIVAAVDVREGIVRVEGWERESSRTLAEVFEDLERLGIGEAIVTDIGRDGTLAGPSLGLYRRLRDGGMAKRVRIFASGGVGAASDIAALARVGGLGGAIVGKALIEGRFTLARARATARTADAIPPRIIPCLDVRNGRVVKGVRFESIRDAGDPVECAIRYEEEGADELVVLDISATTEERKASIETIRAISKSLFIPLTVGGGVRSVEDFRALLRAGADRVAINTAAVENPDLIGETMVEFGRQAVVLACDARRTPDGFRVATRAGSRTTDLDPVEWCRRAERLGAGEVLLTSIDADGTRAGFDLELLRAVTSVLTIGVIASGGAGAPGDFADAIDRGGARAALAAGLFHDHVLTIGEVKAHLRGNGIRAR